MIYQETITPQKAKNYLAKLHPNQRNMNKQRVMSYSQEMKGGSWEVSPDAIAFDEDGYLVNGRHRLEALIQSGEPQDFFVATGLSQEAFTKTDQGQKRSSNQLLKACGFEIPHSDAIKVISDLSTGKIFNNRKITTNDKLIEVANYYKEEAKELPRGEKQFYNASLKATLILALKCGLSPDIPYRVCKILSSYIPEKPEDYPIMAWIKHKQKSKNGYYGQSSRLQDFYVAQRIVRALDKKETITFIRKNDKVFYKPKV